MNELLTAACLFAITVGALLAFSPSISLALVRSRGRTLPASLSVRMTEEWAGELAAIPDRAAKLAFAVGIRSTRLNTFVSPAEGAMSSELNRRPVMFLGGWITVIAVPTILFAIVAWSLSFQVESQDRSGWGLVPQSGHANNNQMLDEVLDSARQMEDLFAPERVSLALVGGVMGFFIGLMLLSVFVRSGRRRRSHRASTHRRRA